MINGKLHQYAPADFITREVDGVYKLLLPAFRSKGLNIHITKDGKLCFSYDKNVYEVKLKVLDSNCPEERCYEDAPDFFDLTRVLRYNDDPTIEIVWKNTSDVALKPHYTKLFFNVSHFFNCKDELKTLIQTNVETKQEEPKEDVHLPTPPQINRLWMFVGIGVAALGLLLVCSKVASNCFAGTKGTSIGQCIMNFISNPFGRSM